ncbi:hypothetical protein N3K66_002920 [Trichothecium roseum]|uniref:Uncharacterized protein n=1 Tax=Trichothecium roseum TaxID=47278 RepID=A0ACC0V404_9HYPO|nr:hypothetical protein N3K66_002920 [Trichothecium roseum]
MSRHYQRVFSATPDIAKTLDRLNQALCGFDSKFGNAGGNPMGAATKAVQQLRDISRSTMAFNDAEWKTAVDKAASLTHQAAKCVQDKAKEYTRDNPVHVADIVGGALLVAHPGPFRRCLLNMLGFSSQGVTKKSVAARINSGMGNVAKWSPFATLQSAGAGGYGSAVINDVNEDSALFLGIQQQARTQSRTMHKGQGKEPEQKKENKD